MSVTYGFYNSYNGDRKYNAEQFGSIFDGVIEDGVYQKIKNGTKAPFAVTPSSGTLVTVDIGRAWLKHTWTYNDAPIAIDCGSSHALYTRTDAIVIEVDTLSRTNVIKCIQADVTTATRRAALTYDEANGLYQYLIAWITRSAGTSAITEADISYQVGVGDNAGDSALKWVTAPVQSYEISYYASAWESAWETWYQEKIGDGINGEYPTAFSDWMSRETSEFEAWLRNANRSIPSGSTANLIARLEALENLMGGIESASGYSYQDALTDAGGSSLYSDTGATLDGRVVFIMAGEE